jgi:hypothetical protein
MPDQILVEIDAGLFEAPEPGNIELLEIVPVPNDLKRVQVMKRHAQPDIAADTHAQHLPSTWKIGEPSSPYSR